MLLPRSLAFTITLILIRTVVVVVVVVNINLLPVAERNKLLILLAVPAVLAVILLVLPAVLAVFLLVLLVLLTSHSLGSIGIRKNDLIEVSLSAYANLYVLRQV